MFQVNHLTITHKKDLRTILEDFSLVLNDGDKAVMIGEEGNGKSTLMRYLYDPELCADYAECEGTRVLGKERLGYLPQDLFACDREKTVYKMHTVKAMGRRFEKEDENMTQMPEMEEAIFFKLGKEDSAVPAGKTVLEYTLSELMTPTQKGGERCLSRDIFLRIRGPEKICIVGKNGAGKTTLLRKIAEEMLLRKDIRVQYMPQNYEDLLDPGSTPVDFLDTSGEKKERTRIRTYLGSLKYTADEMEHPIRELSGGQKAKVLLLKMSLSDANVLILDEPTRNFSPLSGPVIRRMIHDYKGAVISISHDRKFIDEVCDTVYELTPTGLIKKDR